MRSCIGFLCLAVLLGCSTAQRVGRKQFRASLSHTTEEMRRRDEASEPVQADSSRTTVDSTASSSLVFGKTSDWVDDDHTGGKMLKLDIERVTVVARSRTLAERDGRVEIDFLVILPKELQGNSQSMLITPYLLKDTARIALEPLEVRGGLYSKLQDRNYWRYYKYRDLVLARSGGEITVEDSIRLHRAFERFVDHPYLTQARFDSITRSTETISYIYKQTVKTEEGVKKLLVTIEGQVKALDGSVFYMPPLDTLSYNISSVLAFVDPADRYVKKIISKYASVEDRAFLNFRVGRTELIDTMGDNAAQLAKIRRLMGEILEQNEYYVDRIVVSASSSPEGDARSNLWLSRGRAESLKGYLRKQFDYPEMDTLLRVEWVGEDFPELLRLVEADEVIEPKKAIVELLSDEKTDPDVRERRVRERFPTQYRYMLDNLYPRLRSVRFTYALRRVGMIKDTIQTTEVDTLYATGRDLLARRHYREASTILYPYRDQNSAVALLSLGFNQSAREVLFELEPTATVLYLRAIVCARLGERRLAKQCFVSAMELNPSFEFRGRLDPEIATLMNLR